LVRLYAPVGTTSLTMKAAKQPLAGTSGPLFRRHQPRRRLFIRHQPAVLAGTVSLHRCIHSSIAPCSPREKEIKHAKNLPEGEQPAAGHRNHEDKGLVRCPLLSLFILFIILFIVLRLQR